MRMVTRGLIGIISVVFFLGGVALVTLLGSGVAQAQVTHNDLNNRIRTQAVNTRTTVKNQSKNTRTVVRNQRLLVQGELTAQHDMIKQAITDTQTAIQGDLTTLQAAVDALAAEPPCGAGTEGQRFVPDTTEVCDNTTGLHWEQNPDSITRNHADALTHCPTLGTGNRLPEVKELISIVDYAEANQATALNTPNGPFSNVQSSTYWSATTFADLPTFAWRVFFATGTVLGTAKTGTHSVWCVRSGP